MFPSSLLLSSPVRYVVTAARPSTASCLWCNRPKIACNVCRHFSSVFSLCWQNILHYLNPHTSLLIIYNNCVISFPALCNLGDWHWLINILVKITCCYDTLKFVIVFKSPPLCHILNQMNLVNALLLQIHFDIVLLFMTRFHKWYLPFTFSVHRFVSVTYFTAD